MARLSSLVLVCALALSAACAPSAPKAPDVSASATTPPSSTYSDNTGRKDVLSGGARMIPISTPKGTFNVWTKRVGNNPTIKVLLLHGGPGMTHEYFEAADSWFPGANVEYYYYDQLGSFYSDQPKEPSLWEIPRFVE
ncbi:MAG: proline iminopeptidase, partial [Gemmatimonadaceae bacterium]